jgi:hypothetical protein
MKAQNMAEMAGASAAVEEQSGKNISPHPVNIRVTIPFWPRSFFITLIVGLEKRSSIRRRQERNRHPLLTWGNFFAYFTAGTVFQIALFFLLLVTLAL